MNLRIWIEIKSIETTTILLIRLLFVINSIWCLVSSFISLNAHKYHVIQIQKYGSFFLMEAATAAYQPKTKFACEIY